MLDNNNNVSVLPEGHVTMPINFCCNDYERKRKKYSIVKKKHFLNLYFFNKKKFQNFNSFICFDWILGAPVYAEHRLRWMNTWDMMTDAMKFRDSNPNTSKQALLS